MEDGGNGATAFNSHVHSDVIKGFRVSNKLRGFFRDCSTCAVSQTSTKGRNRWWAEGLLHFQSRGKAFNGPVYRACNASSAFGKEWTGE